MHKIAILSDIHGNLTALEAVLADASKEKATEYWVLGDYLMPGPGSSEILRILQKLPNITFVSGNWDDFFLLSPTTDFSNPTKLYGARLAMYQHQQLKEVDLTFMKELPEFAKKEVHDLKFLITHHLPHQKYGGDLRPNGDQDDFDSLFSEHIADVAIYGHTHHQLMRYSSSGQIIINPGAVCLSFFHWEKHRSSLNRAQYTLLEVDENGIGNICFKKIPYDIKKELTLATARNLPYLELYKDAMETGRSYTHNHEVLKRINDEQDILNEVMTYFNRGDNQ